MLRPPTAADEEGYLRVFLRPEVNEWLRPAPLQPLRPEDAAAMLGDDLRHWGEFGYGPWAVLDDGEEYVGRVGLHQTTVEAIPEVELVWTIDPDRQGEGLATGAARAGLELARERGLPEVVALALPSNFASRAVAEKIGLQYEGKIEHAGLPHVIYRLGLA
ncbi:MAG: GNAT family N-acetyltransferase [Solirubrobacterales bacterium]